MISLQDNYAGGPQGSPVTPQRPVQEVSIGQVGQIFTGMVEGAYRNDMAAKAAAARQSENLRQLREEALVDNATNSFFMEANNVAKAYDKGHITQTEAKTRINSILTKKMGQYSSQTRELHDYYDKFMSSFGLGKTISEGTQKDQEKQALRSQYIEEGLLSPYDSEDQFNAVHAREMAYAATAASIQRDVQKLELDSKVLSVEEARRRNSPEAIERERRTGYARMIEAEADAVTAKLAKDEKILERKVTNFVLENGDRFIDSTLKTAQKSAEIIAANPGNNDIVAAEIAKLEAQAGETKIILDQMAGIMNPEIVEPLKNTVDEIVKLNIRMYKNEIEQEVYDNAVKQQRSKITFQLMQSDEVAVAKVLSDMFPNADNILDLTMGKKISEVFQDVSTRGIVALHSLDPKEQGSVGALLRSNIRADNEGLLEEAQKLSLFQNVNGVIKDVPVQQVYFDNPQEWNQVMDFLASPEMGSLVTNNGSLLDTDALSQANDIIATEYAEKVVVALKDASTESLSILRSSGLDKKPLFEMFELSWSGETATLVPKQGAPSPFNSEQVSSVRKSIVPIVNRLIRSAAHLEGHTDYQKMFEVFAPRIMQSAGVPTTTGTGAGTKEAEDVPTVEEETGQDSRTDDDIFKQYGINVNG